ncbi:MAG: hypothetical protein RLZZ455_176 [Candidatus Parcubacteria bacterium]
MTKARRNPSFEEEYKKWKEGYLVAGVDEVGRGAFAGPLVVGAVVFPPLFHADNTAQKILHEVNDSKLLSPKKREELSVVIKEHARLITIVEVSVRVIDKVGIGKANQIGFRKAICNLRKLAEHTPLFVLLDGFSAPYAMGGVKNQMAIIKGDQKSLSIAAASIIAKVHRDNYMKLLRGEYAKYQFAKHKGYGTVLHRDLLKKYGLSRLHRSTFCHSIFT